MSATVVDKDGTPHYLVRGYWDDYIEYAKVTDCSGRHLKTGPFTELWRAAALTSVSFVHFAVCAGGAWAHCSLSLSLLHANAQLCNCFITCMV